MPGFVICGGVLYEPQPKADRVKNNKRIVLMNTSTRQFLLK
jgi:hypothetical protein